MRVSALGSFDNQYRARPKHTPVPAAASALEPRRPARAQTLPRWWTSARAEGTCATTCTSPTVRARGTARLGQPPASRGCACAPRCAARGWL